MVKQSRKRERLEETIEIGRICEEAEASRAKRLCKETNADVVCQIMSKMDNEELFLGPEEIEEEMVWDMMKMLEEEMYQSPSCSDDTGTSGNGSDELESSGDTDCSFNSELDYLMGASDDELGIPCSPSVYTANDYDYDFFKCIEVERAERQLLLQMWLDNSDMEQEGSDLFPVHDLHIVCNQIESV